MDVFYSNFSTNEMVITKTLVWRKRNKNFNEKHLLEWFIEDVKENSPGTLNLNHSSKDYDYPTNLRILFRILQSSS